MISSCASSSQHYLSDRSSKKNSTTAITPTITMPSSCCHAKFPLDMISAIENHDNAWRQRAEQLTEFLDVQLRALNTKAAGESAELMKAAECKIKELQGQIKYVWEKAAADRSEVHRNCRRECEEIEKKARRTLAALRARGEEESLRLHECAQRAKENSGSPGLCNASPSPSHISQHSRASAAEASRRAASVAASTAAAVTAKVTVKVKPAPSPASAASTSVAAVVGKRCLGRPLGAVNKRPKVTIEECWAAAASGATRTQRLATFTVPIDLTSGGSSTVTAVATRRPSISTSVGAPFATAGECKKQPLPRQTKQTSSTPLLCSSEKEAGRLSSASNNSGVKSHTVISVIRKRGAISSRGRMVDVLQP